MLVNSRKVTDEFQPIFKWIKKHEIEGDVVEFGVYNADSFIKLCQAVHHREFSDKQLIGFDSFKGLPPTTKPIDPDDEKLIRVYQPGQYCSDGKENVEKYINERTDFIRFELVEGWFADTLPLYNKCSRVCLANIDCDLYEGTVEALEWLTPRLSNNSILRFDEINYEYHGHKSCRFHEYAAFVEWQERNRERFTIIDFELHKHLGVQRNDRNDAAYIVRKLE